MAALKVVGGLLVFYGTTGRSFTIRTPKCKLVATLDLADTGGFPIPGGPYVPGATINISGILAGDQTLRFGPAHYDGVSYPRRWYEGSFEFKAQQIVAPGNSASARTVQTPFTMKGFLRGFAANNNLGNGGPATFDEPLAGRGTATLVLGPSYVIGGTQQARDARLWMYEFE